MFSSTHEYIANKISTFLRLGEQVPVDDTYNMGGGSGDDDDNAYDDDCSDDTGDELTQSGAYDDVTVASNTSPVLVDSSAVAAAAEIGAADDKPEVDVAKSTSSSSDESFEKIDEAEVPPEALVSGQTQDDVSKWYAMSRARRAIVSDHDRTDEHKVANKQWS